LEDHYFLKMSAFESDHPLLATGISGYQSVT